MPTVVTFWRLPDEEAAFVEYVVQTGEVVAFPFERVHDPAEIKPQPFAEYIAQNDPNDLLFGLAAHAGLLRTQKFSEAAGTFFMPNNMSSPVITYNRGKLRSPNKLGGSNLATYSSYPSEDRSQMLDHPAEFVTWTKKIFRWVRGAASEKISKGWRATPAVAAAMTKGLEAVQ